MRHHPRKRFGQHFLHDAVIIKKMITALNPQPEDTIVEIGPGEGALTLPLLQRHSPLIAIEIDRDLIPLLQTRCATIGELQIYQQDVLKFNFTEFANGRALKIVGNLPYNISTPLLFHLLNHKAVIQDMYFMLQHEVAERLASEVNTSAYGRLAIMIQHDFMVEYLFSVPPQAFKPAPQVESAVVRLSPRPKNTFGELQAPDIFAAIVNQAFQKRRKMLRNSLATYFAETELKALAFDPCARPAELSIADYVMLANSFSQKGVVA